MRPSTTSRTDPWWVRLIDKLSGLAAWLAGAVMAIMCVDVLVDVVGRTLWDHPLEGTLERVTYWWMPMLIVLGLAAAHRHDEHVRVTMIPEVLPPAHRHVLESAAALIVVLVVGFVTYYVIGDAQAALAIKQTAGAAVPVEVWPTKIVIVVGMVIFSLQSVANLYRNLRNRPSRSRGSRAVVGETV